MHGGGAFASHWIERQERLMFCSRFLSWLTLQAGKLQVPQPKEMSFYVFGRRMSRVLRKKIWQVPSSDLEVTEKEAGCHCLKVRSEDERKQRGVGR